MYHNCMIKNTFWPAHRYLFFITMLLIFRTSPSCAFSSVDFYKEASAYKSVNAFAAAIHCAHETGDWRSRLWTECYNGAGIKTNAAWRMLGMPSVRYLSAEDVNGRDVKKVSSFRKYPTIKSFLKDYARKIREDYPVACKYNNNVWGYICGLHQGKYGKWATDHRYFEKLASKTVQLAPDIYGAQWRTKLTRQFEVAKGFGILEPWQIKAISERLGD